LKKAKVLSIAAIQMRCRKGDVKWNLNHSIELIHRAVGEKVDLICFPESVLDGYACGEAGHARTVPGKETGAIAKLAASLRVWIMWSLAEKFKNGVSNTALLFDRKGRIRLRYRKVHLCLEADEHLAYVSGVKFPVVAVERIKVGVMICFDRHYPEAARELRLRGAQLILHPTATDWFKPDPGSINTAMMRTRAYENRCFILSVNQANYGGGSTLFGPWGEVIASAGEKEEILYCPVRINLIHKMPKNFFELMKARRPDVYHRLGESKTR
jgi:predicted amidohydrolase